MGGGPAPAGEAEAFAVSRRGGERLSKLVEGTDDACERSLHGHASSTLVHPKTSPTHTHTQTKSQERDARRRVKGATLLKRLQTWRSNKEARAERYKVQDVGEQVRGQRVQRTLLRQGTAALKMR